MTSLQTHTDFTFQHLLPYSPPTTSAPIFCYEIYGFMHTKIVCAWTVTARVVLEKRGK